jgi:hypothetical protein
MQALIGAVADHGSWQQAETTDVALQGPLIFHQCMASRGVKVCLWTLNQLNIANGICGAHAESWLVASQHFKVRSSCGTPVVGVDAGSVS